uniref:tetraacyldisaccharide 4'-kinase n=1 Tax=Acinetobacter baumannii TaxID=470 RepID=UPI001489CC06
PVMVIGNITVWGSGKTLLLIVLVNYLEKHNVKLGVIIRGYGVSGFYPILVTSVSQAVEAGDEHALIVQSTTVPMAVVPNRHGSIELVLASTKLDLI